MEKYDPQKIKSKWQKKWAEWGIYRTTDFSEKEKLYVLDMFPYPSGAGLHVGHTRIYTASDVLARYFRMKGYNVLHPMGWDAFGLPAENDAIKKKINPHNLVPQNIGTFKQQMQSLGFSYDWSREFSTADPAYYKWTQWLFIQFFKMGLLYQKKVPINWCEHCQTGLANEEVLAGGIHERCGKPVVKREVKQWLFRITKYADRLLNDLEGLDWPESILEMQRNWIGRSEGTEIDFSLTPPKSLQPIRVFTTRPDTIFGVTALVLAPEHPLIQALISPDHPATPNLPYAEDVRRYVDASKRKSDLERTDLQKAKTGVFTGLCATNPANGGQIPVWVADYVIGWYGGGAVMLVPAHDQRDYAFAKKYDLPIKTAISPTPPNLPSEPYEGEGTLVDSGEFTGLPSETARERITEWLSEKDFGRKSVSYKLRDWVFSRQRYWGEPIPLVFCQKCADKGITWWDLPEADSFLAPTALKTLKSPNLAGWFPMPEEDLPLELPYVEKYEPTGTGESPLAAIKDWVNVKCPHCGGPAKRETDTMPNWAGSCWYFLRFADPHDDQAVFDPAKVNPPDQPLSTLINPYQPSTSSSESVSDEAGLPLRSPDERRGEGGWLPVDWYLGGAEHAVLHLLYARFWVKAMSDLGLVNFQEPFRRLRGVGMVQGEDGRKMSKSYGNVVNPDDVVAAFGADTLRLYEMFMGPFGQAINWNTKGVEGAHRFLKKVWSLSQSSPNPPTSPKPLIRELHRLVKKVGEDIETIKFNTAIAAMMEFLNEVRRTEVTMQKQDWGVFLRLLAPFAPHITEELWSRLPLKTPTSPKNPNSIHRQPWPSYDPRLLEEEEVTVIIQVDGKVRDRLTVKKDIARTELRNLVEQRPNVRRFLSGRRVKEMYLVPNRLVNFATEPRT
jgi:leucyl-tRNA synthetase